MSGVRPRILALAPEVVEVIAAGEVVERPASVVKELVENALDAGALRVEVHAEDGGRRLLRVLDDGVGMDEVDLALAFAPHATSKIRDLDDLASVASFGFRGEALASIGAVAEASVVSRPRGGRAAARVENRRGERGAVTPAAGPEGTTVEVRSLFLGLPARRKFLRSAATEAARITEVVVRFALGRPDVAFVLLLDGRPAFRAPAGEDPRARAERALGADRARDLLPVAAAVGDVAVRGFVATPDGAGSGRAPQYLSVNGRAVADRTVAHAVREAYHGLLTVGRQPAWVLDVAVPPGAVDVNVHPAKSEVRFRRPREVHDAVRTAVREAILAGERAPALRTADAGRGVRDALEAYLGGVAAAPAEPRLPFRPSPRAAPAPPAGAAPAPVGPVLQVRDAYIVHGTERGIAIVDQHALHERVLLHRLRHALDDGPPAVQRLLVPEVIETGPAEALLAESAAEVLAAVGLPVRRFGEAAVAVEGVPAALSGRSPRELALAALGRVAAEGAAVSRSSLVAGLLETMACHGAVRAGDPLPAAEARALLEEALHVPEGGHCAHGRPTELVIPWEDLERRFRRT